MIAFAKKTRHKLAAPALHTAFLKMLPAIRRSAEIAFRNLPPELREELIEETIANAFVAHDRLAKAGKAGLVGPTPLARFAIAQVRSGRRVGNRRRIGDALSGYAQHQKSFSVESLYHFDRQESQWREIVLEDRRAGPAEIAACRIDFESWLKLLPRRQRKIALTLAGGETTSGAAKLYGVTAARISQLRGWLRESWEVFQGEVYTPAAA